MKILHISSEDEYYGSAKCLKELLLEERKNENIEPVVVTPFYGEINKFCNKYCIKNYHVRYTGFFYFKHDKLSSLKFFIRKIQYSFLKKYSLKKIESIIRLDDFDLIHTNNSGYDLGGLIAKKYGIRHVWHLREGGLKQFSFIPYMNNFISYMNDTADSFIAVSDFVKKEWIALGLPENKIKTIYDGVSVLSAPVIENKNEMSLNDKMNKVKFVLCGAIMKAKGQLKIINMVSLLPSEIQKKIEIHFYGDTSGAEFLEAKKYVDDYKLNSIIFFEGYENNIWQVLPKYDYGLNYSSAEAFGRVTVEYMIAGLPVLAVNTGANEELIGKYGIIIEKDSYDSFKKGIEDCLKNVDYYRSHKIDISSYARDVFSAEVNLKNIINFFLSF